jgi:hypothetical protein
LACRARISLSSADVLDELGHASVVGHQEALEVLVEIAVHELLLQLQRLLAVGVVSLA